MGEVQQRSANHRVQDISTAVVKEVVIQIEQRGLGGVTAKKLKKERISRQKPTLNRMS